MINEDTLRQTFWEHYRYRVKGGFMFEVSMENKNRKADLVTIEEYQGRWQINAFEFKLNDYDKVMEQAKANIRYCNRSWIVMPEKKRNHLKNHAAEIKGNGLGAITIEDGGRWHIIVPAPARDECLLNQEILGIAEMNSYKPSLY